MAPSAAPLDTRAFLDAEGAFDAPRLRASGTDVTTLLGAVGEAREEGAAGAGASTAGAAAVAEGALLAAADGLGLPADGLLLVDAGCARRMSMSNAEGLAAAAAAAVAAAAVLVADAGSAELA